MYGTMGISLFLSDFPSTAILTLSRVWDVSSETWPYREMLQCKEALYQECKGSWPQSGSRCTSVLMFFLDEGILLSQPTKSNSSSQAPLFCWEEGSKHKLPPTLPHCQSKVPCTSSTACRPKRKAVRAEKRGTGWLGWVRSPKAQAWFTNAAISRYQFPITLAVCRAVRGKLQYGCGHCPTLCDW